MVRWLQNEPKQLMERRQTMSEAMADYPLYDPPNRQGATYLRRRPNQSAEEHDALFSEFIQRGRENLSYLLEQRSTRLAALRDFLAKFGVQAGLDDAGLAAVSGWCPENCGALIAEFRDTATLRMLFQMQTPWTNQWRGFNVVFDLGFYLGESKFALGIPCRPFRGRHEYL
jgi:hypothetical protein